MFTIILELPSKLFNIILNRREYFSRFLTIFYKQTLLFFFFLPSSLSSKKLITLIKHTFCSYLKVWGADAGQQDFGNMTCPVYVTNLFWLEKKSVYQCTILTEACLSYCWNFKSLGDLRGGASCIFFSFILVQLF